METNAPKRRKLGHENGGPGFESTASSSMGASGSSTFMLEAEELLKEVRLDYGRAFSGLNDTLRELKDAIEGLEGHGPKPIGDALVSFEKANRISVPYYPGPRPPKDSPYKLAFEKPAQVNVVGSYASQTMINTQPVKAVDMIVAMPATTFQEKDYRDFRYFWKRAYYLACVTAGLRKRFSGMDFSYANLNGNPLLPILVVRPKSKSGKKDAKDAVPRGMQYEIHIIPSAPEGIFPATKLSANSSAIRSRGSENTEEAKTPTPFYNSTIKADALFSSYLRLLHGTANSCPSFKDACILGRIWLQQRGFTGETGFGHFQWAVLMALLLKSGGRKGEPVLSPSLHCTQLFKATLQYLASANLHKKPILLGSTPPALETIRQSGPVLYDSERAFNLLFQLSAWSAAMLAEQAQWSLSAINKSPSSQFETLFIAKADQPLQLFDLLARVKIPKADPDSPAADARGAEFGFCDNLYRTLKKALGERASLIYIENPQSAPWPVTATMSSTKTDNVLVGIIVDPMKASQSKEYGPAYEQKKEAAKFRDFWGEKSELWQFPDGNIVESLNWTEFSPQGFAGICQAIISYILKFRLKLRDSDLEFHWQETSNILPLMPTDKTAFDAVRTAFSIFEQDLRALEDLPLHIKQIAPTSSELRYASLRAPDLDSGRNGTLPMDVIITFESSGKWPENLAAIQRLKTAILVRIANSLQELKEEIKTYVGLEDATRDTDNIAYLDVVYEDGGSFRIRICSDQEQTLLERQTKDQTLERHVRTEAADSLAAFKRAYINLPLHNQTISTFCTRMPALSSSIRLTKHWFNSHRLSNYFEESLIELFVLQAFSNPYPFPVPTSGTAGFHRTLALLASWDWREEPLVVDVSDALSGSQRLEIATRLQAWRKIDPHMNRTTLFVATPSDVSGLAWTSSGLPKVVAARMTSLARAAARAVRERGVRLDPRALFQASLSDYDVVVHLSARALRAVVQLRSDDDDDEGTMGGKKRSLFKNLVAARDEDSASPPPPPPFPESPATALLRRLGAALGDALLFFHGGPEDAVVAALWNPQLQKRRRLAANMPCSLMPVDADGDEEGEDEGEGEGEEVQYDVNRAAILAEIARVGGDLIERIEERKGGREG
ncbi:pre-rRNA processing protein utp22 [Xylariaceae sp. FL0804]|nr:pre-rRNA processing protein utp22 [Xylariaceae sp. FL0804]